VKVCLNCQICFVLWLTKYLEIKICHNVLAYISAEINEVNKLDEWKTQSMHLMLYFMCRLQFFNEEIEQKFC